MSKKEIITEGPLKIANKTGDYFNSLDKNEKYETFSSTIEDLKNNSFIKTCEKYWKNLTEEQKLQLYNDGNILKLTTFAKYNIKHNPPYLISNTITNLCKDIYNNGYENGISNNIFQLVPQVCRLFIQLGIFKKPNGLKIDDLKNDIKNDAKNLKRDLRFVQVVLPTLIDIITEGAGTSVDPAIRGGIEILIKGADWYKNEGCDMLITNLEKNNITHNSQQDIYNTFLEKAA